MLLYAGITQADLLPNFGTNDEDLWKSGANLYIRLTDQDQSKKDVLRRRTSTRCSWPPA